MLRQDGLELGAAVLVDHRHDDAQAGVLAHQQLRGLQEAGREQPDLRFAAAGHQGQHPAAGLQAQARARGRAVRPHRNEFGQGVADVGHGHDLPAVQLDLEGEQHQHMRDRAADLVDALEAPGPDRRADEMHGGNAGGAQLFFQAQVEVRRIDPHEHVRTPVQRAAEGVAPGADQARRPAQRIDVAEHGQRVHGVPGLEAFPGHGRAADAPGPDLRIARPQAAQHARRQQVAGGFSGHDGGGKGGTLRPWGRSVSATRRGCLRHRLKDRASPGLALRVGARAQARGHGRAMPRLEARRKSSRVWTAGASPGGTAWRTARASMACSTLSWRR